MSYELVHPGLGRLMCAAVQCGVRTKMVRGSLFAEGRSAQNGLRPFLKAWTERYVPNERHYTSTKGLHALLHLVLLTGLRKAPWHWSRLGASSLIQRQVFAGASEGWMCEAGLQLDLDTGWRTPSR
eukprot:351025-Chlamydomonas_euryale.AAC.4